MEREASFPKMDWAATDLPTAFKNFKSHCEFMFGGPLKAKDEEEQCNYLMIWVGDKGRDIYSTWNLDANQKKKLSNYYTNFEAYCKPKSNQIYSRYMFKSRVQKEGEPFEQFVMDLRLLIKECGFDDPNLRDEMVRDNVVFGIRDGKIRQELIKVGNTLTLDTAIDIARTHELSQSQSHTMDNEDKNIHYCGARPKHTAQPPRSRKNKTENQKQKSENRKAKPKKKKCTRCGKENHPYEKCPAKGKQCAKCKMYNHFASECKSRSVHLVQGESDTEESEDFYILSINDHNDTGNEFSEIIEINHKKVKFQLDSGAKCNILKFESFKKLGLKLPLRRSGNMLKSFSGHRIKPVGIITLPVTVQDKVHHIDFQVVDINNVPNVLGIDSCLKLKLICKGPTLPVNTCSVNEDLVSEYSDLFEGIGCLPGEHRIITDKSANPVIHPPRKIPVAMKAKIKTELDRMEKLEIIEKQTKPTKWVNSFVAPVKAKQI